VNIDKIAVGPNPPYEINAIIEVPLGSDPIKYEFDKSAGAIVVDRFLYATMFYPCSYGFIPHTLAEDGDAVDVMVMAGYRSCRAPCCPRGRSVCCACGTRRAGR
jgi:inorganic pyrophosphatase